MRKAKQRDNVAEESGLYEKDGSMGRPHERLDAWRLSVELVLAIYGVTKSFPKEETFGLSSQMRRAAVSVPANIAEGSARKNGPERKQFYYISRASLSELETHIVIARRLGYMSQDGYIRLMGFSSRIAAMLNGMIKK